MTFLYHHERTGCIYDVHLATDGTFAIAYCHIDRMGNDPIVYSSLEDMPDGPRHDIEQQIHDSK